MIASRPSKIPSAALVLTAGLGTRLQPLTAIRAKASVPVNGETLARRVVRWLAAQGVLDLVLNLHHLPDTITASVGDGSDLGVRVRYSWENPVLGSAGGPRHALPLLLDSLRPDPGSRTPDPGSRIPDPGCFLIVNGDTLTDVDLAAMAAGHAESGAAVTMALVPNPRPDKYGGVLVDGRWITGFTRAGSVSSSFHFIGVQIATGSVFAELADGHPAETVNALYPRLIKANPHSIAAFICDASFRDIGTPSDYLATSLELAQIEGVRMISTEGVHIDPSATVIRSAVWDDVTIGQDVEIVECIVCDGARVPAGSHYHRCALLPATARAPAAHERVAGDLLIAEISS